VESGSLLSAAAFRDIKFLDTGLKAQKNGAIKKISSMYPTDFFKTT